MGGNSGRSGRKPAHRQKPTRSTLEATFHALVMYSYRETLTFGLTGDRDTTPDLEILASGIATALEELVELVERAG